METFECENINNSLRFLNVAYKNERVAKPILVQTERAPILSFDAININTSVLNEDTPITPLVKSLTTTVKIRGRPRKKPQILPPSKTMGVNTRRNFTNGSSENEEYEAVNTWMIGKHVGMYNNKEEEVARVLRRSYRFHTPK